jgi:hypothetical protein
VLAREAILNDAQVVEMLTKHFVCFAIDNADNSNTTKMEREFLKPLGGTASTQGMSTFTAGGQHLASGGGFDAKPNLKMLKDALSKFQSDDKFKDEPAPVFAKDADRAAVNETKGPPEGGLVLYVTWKILEPEKLPNSKSSHNDKHLSNSLGVDRLWVRKDEAEALAKGAFPDSLRKRMASYLIYVVPGKLKTDGIKLAEGRLSGDLLSDTGERADTLGFVEAKDGKVTRFDLVIKGLGKNCGAHGFEGPLTVLPKDTTAPVALSFMLADPADDLSRTLPYRARSPQYLK